MPRIFTALEIPTSVATRLTMLQGGLPGARWVDRENLHITLRYVGDVDGSQARDFNEALVAVKTPPFNLEIDGLGVFGKSKPRSLFASVRKSEHLQRLQSAQERICQQIGLEPDGRRFTPHVTLARVSGAGVGDVARYLSHYGGFSSVPFSVDRFVLLSSRESTGGGPYVLEESYQLEEQSFASAG